jgi:hypothetical protein
MVQALPSKQVVGQMTAGGSQVSVGSTTPLPQRGEQSGSVTALQPGAQHPSPDTQLVMAVWVQATLQFAALPVTWSIVQALPSVQSVEQDAAGSHVSPASIAPLPQAGEQSESVLALHPAGQQPSSGSQVTMLVWLQATLQLSILPVIWSMVQALPSVQLVGQDAAGSQVSPLSTTPLPQAGEQSESVLALHPAGQQRSPEAQPTMTT